jgi:hypothetical protein
MSLFNNCKIMPVLSPASQSDDTARESDGIAMSGFRSCMFCIATGSLADSNATFTVLVEDSPDDSSYTAVNDAYLNGTEAGASFTFTHDDAVRKVEYVGVKAYVRITITPSGNGSAALTSCIALLGDPRDLPQSSQS